MAVRTDDQLKPCWETGVNREFSDPALARTLFFARHRPRQLGGR